MSGISAASAPREDTRETERIHVELACEGDAEAFRAIVHRHHRGLFSLCVRMVGNRHDAEDLLQLAFTKAYAKLSTYDPTYRLSTWLYRIALNACRDHLKSPRRRERPSAEVPEHWLARHPEEEADSRMIRAERVQQLRHAIDRLPESYREIVLLKDIQELSYQEIHEATGTPITALKIRAVRARAQLRVLVEALP
ncbi:MAG: sigma-70 family RNA polymerase sigma factor [Myxococcales bacterium]|nr:sigma-70 family RNA polymerase sigma factor [Myxococcales bacterium]